MNHVALYEYFHILTDTPKPFRGHQGSCQHVVCDLLDQGSATFSLPQATLAIHIVAEGRRKN
jgi:glutamine synthetase